MDNDYNMNKKRKVSLHFPKGDKIGNPTFRKGSAKKGQEFIRKRALEHKRGT